MSDHDPLITVEQVEAAAGRLRAVEREALLLSARDHLPMNEIAGRLGLSERNAEMLIARALLKVEHWVRRKELRWWHLW